MEILTKELDESRVKYSETPTGFELYADFSTGYSYMYLLVAVGYIALLAIIIYYPKSPDGQNLILIIISIVLFMIISSLFLVVASIYVILDFPKLRYGKSIGPVKSLTKEVDIYSIRSVRNKSLNDVGIGVIEIELNAVSTVDGGEGIVTFGDKLPPDRRRIITSVINNHLSRYSINP